MIINSLSVGNIANTVWTNATRNLTNPTGVFNDASRSLTNAGYKASIGARNTLAASTALELRPAAGKTRVVNLAFTAGAAGTSVVQAWDGTAAITIVSVASSQSGGSTAVLGNASQGHRGFNNDASNASTYVYSGYDETL